MAVVIPRRPFNAEGLRRELAAEMRPRRYEEAEEGGVPMKTIAKHAKKTPSGGIARCKHSGCRRPKIVYLGLGGALRVTEVNDGPLFVYPCPDHPHWHTTSRAQPEPLFTYNEIRRASRVKIKGEWYLLAGVAHRAAVVLPYVVHGRRTFLLNEVEDIRSRRALVLKSTSAIKHASENSYVMPTTQLPGFGHYTRSATVADYITDYLGGHVDEFDLEALATAFRAAVNVKLSFYGVTLIGDDFYAQAPVHDEAHDAIHAALVSVDLGRLARGYER